MKIDPRHLIAVETIRRAGGLTRAADQLGTSQPALSRLVSDLELRLNGGVFDRSTRPRSTTKLGEALSRQGAAILHAQDRASNEVDLFHHGTAGKLRIAGPAFFTDGVISRLLPAFHRRHPDISFEIVYGYADELRAAVREGRADLALYPRSVGDLDEGLEFTFLLEAANRIVCRVGHPILKLAYPSPLALLDYSWVRPPDGSPLAADMNAVLSAMDMAEANIIFSGGSLASVLSFVENSDSLAVLPGKTIEAIGPLFSVQAVPVEVETPRRPLGVLTPPADELDFTTRTFVEFLVRSLRG